MKKGKMIKCTAAGLALTACIYLFCEDNLVGLTEYDLKSDKLPASFDGYKIAHLSDYHNSRSPVLNSMLLKKIRAFEPDMIAITGDMIDSRTTHREVALDLAKKLLRIAPVYYVTGNHESRWEGKDRFLADLSAAGVRVLQNKSCPIEQGGEYITVAGVFDPTDRSGDCSENDAVTRGDLQGLNLQGDVFNLLLAHHPELLYLYSGYGADAVLCGHAHGGQVILPFGGGMLAPNQGWNPRYYGGLYHYNQTVMVLSRGIGNSSFPFRVNNPPEVVGVTLHCDNRKTFIKN